jgi:hypothetical protein
MLDKIAEHLIQKALAGKSPEVVAEAQRRLEAGETVTIEDCTGEQGEMSLLVVLDKDKRLRVCVA